MDLLHIGIIHLVLPISIQVVTIAFVHNEWIWQNADAHGLASRRQQRTVALRLLQCYAQYDAEMPKICSTNRTICGDSGSATTVGSPLGFGQIFSWATP